MHRCHWRLTQRSVVRLIESNGVQQARQDRVSVQILSVQGGAEELLMIAVEGTKRICPGCLRSRFASISETEITARRTGRVVLLKT